MLLTSGVPRCFRLSLSELEVPFCLITSPLDLCLPPGQKGFYGETRKALHIACNLEGAAEPDFGNNTQE